MSLIQFAWLKIDGRADALHSRWTAEISEHADAQLRADLMRHGIVVLPTPLTDTIRMMGAYAGLKYLFGSVVGVRDSADEDIYKRLSLWYDSEYTKMVQSVTYTMLMGS